MGDLFRGFFRRVKKPLKKIWPSHEQSSPPTSSSRGHATDSSLVAATSSRDSVHKPRKELEEDKSDGESHKEVPVSGGSSAPAACDVDDAGDSRPTTSKTIGSPVNDEPKTESLPAGPQFHSGLWQQAFTQLSKKRQTSLMGLAERGKSSSQPSATVSVVTSDLVTALRQRQTEWEHKSWTITVLSKDGEAKVVRVQDKVADCINFLTAAGDLGVSFAPSLVQQVWPCVKAVLQIPVQDAKQVHIMLQVADKVANAATKGALYEVLYSSANTPLDYFEKIQDVLTQIYKTTLEMLSDSAEALDKGTVHRMVSSVIRTYGQEESQLADLEAQLESAVKDIDRTRISRALEVVEIAREQKVLEWISDVPFTQNHKDERKKRMDGTCNWLLEHDSYREWDAISGPSLMWLQGQSGTGKTCLTSKVVDHTKEVMERWKMDAGLAFFYFKRNDDSRHYALQCLRSLVRQLSTSLQQSGQIRSELQRIYNECNRGGQDLDETICEEQLTKSLSDFPRVTIIIDALDECAKDGRRELIEIFDRLMDNSGARLAIFISSRPYPDIKSILNKRSMVEVGSHNNWGDIDKFVNEKIRQHNHSAWTNEIKDTVIRKLLEKSQGMFRLAQLHIDELLKLNIPEDIMERLETLPKGLKEAYDDIYLNLKEKRSEREFLIVSRAILWMLALRQPPISTFLVQAVRIDPIIYMKRTSESPHTTPETHDEDYVLSYCDGAILLKLCTNLLTLSSSYHWQFCHASVSEYFLENHFSTLQAHAHASCVSALVLIDVARSMHTGHLIGAASTSDIHHDALPKLNWLYREIMLERECDVTMSITDHIRFWMDRTPEFFEDGKLYGYAVQNWMRHVTFIEKSCEDQDHQMDLGYHDGIPALMTSTGVMFLLWKFLGHPNDSSPAYRLWLSWFEDYTREPDVPDWSSDRTDAYASFAIVRYGLFKLLPQCWQDEKRGSPPDQERQHMDIDTTVRSHRGYDLLDIACHFGHASIVKSLLAASIDSTDARKSSNYPVPGSLSLRSLPLSIAARQGHLEVCKTLIQDAGSDPNIPAGTLNPLYIALENNHLDCALFLVHSGADPEITTKTLLQQVSVEHQNLIPFEVEPEGEKSALLQEASTNGDLAAIEQLLRENADVNWEPGNYEIQKHFYLALTCYLPISKRLIHVLKEVGTKGGAAATQDEKIFALQRDSRTNYPVMMEQLYRMEATFQDETVKYGGSTALQAASRSGHLEVVERLLEAGADANAYPAFWEQTALHAAAENGFLAIVERLIQAGANPDIHAGYGYLGKRDPSDAARENGHLIVAERLGRVPLRMLVAEGPPPQNIV
ncbi:hypothetical protein BJ166DRAFT_605992 [Pestalotiopsis sp. NC0098]|nr:hypothetical protein BJ166DRAFT_605992 [Pestalotiopsis sp. NC0098]